MDPGRLLEEHIELIDRLARRACVRVGATAEADDFTSTVKLALIENDYAILRRWEGRSSLATYLAVVIQRLLCDEHERRHGRWRPSAEAERLGPRAVLIEQVIAKQGRTVDEAIPIVCAADASITPAEVVSIAEKLSRRMPRPREVELPDDDGKPIAATDSADAAVIDGELRDASVRAGTLLRDAMDSWPADDRLLLRLRFHSSLTIADIARVMNVPQRPLYRRLESLLARLRQALLAGGIDTSTADDLLAASNRVEMNFSGIWKNGGASRTTTAEEPS